MAAQTDRTRKAGPIPRPAFAFALQEVEESD